MISKIEDFLKIDENLLPWALRGAFWSIFPRSCAKQIFLMTRRAEIYSSLAVQLEEYYWCSGDWPSNLAAKIGDFDHFDVQFD